MLTFQKFNLWFLLGHSGSFLYNRADKTTNQQMYTCENIISFVGIQTPKKQSAKLWVSLGFRGIIVKTLKLICCFFWQFEKEMSQLIKKII